MTWANQGGDFSRSRRSSTVEMTRKRVFSSGSILSRDAGLRSMYSLDTAS